MQELENENDKLKREVSKLVASIAETTDFDQNTELTPAGREFLGMTVHIYVTSWIITVFMTLFLTVITEW